MGKGAACLAAEGPSPGGGRAGCEGDSASWRPSASRGAMPGRGRVRAPPAAAAAAAATPAGYPYQIRVGAGQVRALPLPLPTAPTPAALHPPPSRRAQPPAAGRAACGALACCPPAAVPLLPPSTLALRPPAAPQVIEGLDEGLLTMASGGVRRLYIPGELAFPKGLPAGARSLRSCVRPLWLLAGRG